MSENFEQMLSGGHPNSLGKTLEVVEIVLCDKAKLENLYQTYFSSDEVVRLRTSNAIKRVCLQHPDWIYEYADKLISEIFNINQPSTQWTIAILFRLMTKYLNQSQKFKATEHFKSNLDTQTDWIVINTTMETLFEWSKGDHELTNWLIPRLKKFSTDSHKSISSRATKYLQKIN